MSEKDQLPAAVGEPDPEKSISGTVRMARATPEDMEVGYELAGLLDSISRGYYPARESEIDSTPTFFDSDDRDHLEYLHQRISEIADKSGSIHRVVGAASIFLNPENGIVEFEDDCIELSPSLKDAVKAKELWGYYQEFVRFHGADSITQLVTQRDKLKAENDRLRSTLGRIAKWDGEFPETGQFWEDGDPMSYRSCFGTDGERDYMREVARLALEGEPKEAPHG